MFGPDQVRTALLTEFADWTPALTDVIRNCDDDIVTRLKHQHREQEAQRICLMKIRERGLAIGVVNGALTIGVALPLLFISEVANTGTVTQRSGRCPIPPSER